MRPGETPKYTLRLTFAYDRADVRLVDGQRVEMISPPGETETIQQGQAGFWVELRDTEERTLYQQVVHDPIRHEMEVFDDPESGAIRRVTIDDPQGIFEVLVPDIPEAQNLVLFGKPPESRAAFAPAVELARVGLEAPRRGTEAES